MCLYMFCLLKSLQNPPQVCSMSISILLKGNWGKKKLTFPELPDSKHQSHLKISGQAQRLWITRCSFVRKMALTCSSQTQISLCPTSLAAALDRVLLKAIYRDWKDGKTGSHASLVLTHHCVSLPVLTGYRLTPWKLVGLVSKEYSQWQFKQKYLLRKLKTLSFLLRFS